MKRIIFLTAALIGLALCFLQAYAEEPDVIWSKNLFHRGGCDFVRFYDNETKVLAGTPSGVIYLYETQTGNQLDSFYLGVIKDYAFIDSKNLLAVAAHDTLLIYNLDTRHTESFMLDTIIPAPFGHEAILPVSASFSVEKKQLLIAFETIAATPPWEYDVLVYDMETNNFITVIKNKKTGTIMVKYSPDNKKIAVLTCDQIGTTGKLITNIAIYDVNPFDENYNIINVGDVFVNDIAFSPDGTQIAAACEDGYIRIWEVDNNKFIKAMSDNAYRAYTCLFTKNNEYLITGIAKKDISCYNFYETQNFDKVKQIDIGLYLGVDINESLNRLLSGSSYNVTLANINIVGIAEEKSNNKIEILYPNPANGNITIIFDNPKSQNIQIMITDLYGVNINTIFNGTLEDGTHKISYNCNKLPNGAYFLRVQGGDISITYKLIKE
ncbi:MAG: repeat-containing protein 38, partial [Bacteroidota bacterium]|nr:repeat-containing protein 38 [Bacteroidota bacterium]